MKRLITLNLQHKKTIYIPLLILASLLLMLPLFKPGFPQTHDGYQHLVRTAHFFSSVKQGNLFPTWAGNLNDGLGSPVFLYNWLLPYYAILPLMILGISIVKATKLIIITEFVLSGIGFYLWVNNHLKPKSAFFTSLIFITAPYQLFNIYTRGAVGEAMAFAIAPWVFLFTARLFKTLRLKELTLTSIAISLMILAHHPAALLIMPMLLGYMAILWWERKDTKTLFYFLSAIITALALTTFFWLPAVGELPYTKLLEGTRERFKEHFIEADRFGTPQRYTQLIINTLPLLNVLKPHLLTILRLTYLLISVALGVGVAHLVAAILTLRWISINRYKNKKNKNRIILFLFAIFLFSLFLTLKASFPIWETIPLLKSTLFPWRFFGLATLGGSFLAGWVLEKTRNKKLLAVILLGISLIFIPRHLPKLEKFTSYTDRILLADRTSTDQTGLFLPRWAPNQEVTLTYESSNEIGSTQNVPIPIIPLEENLTKRRFRIDADQQTGIVINTFFFPGWKGFIDRIPTLTTPSAKGLIQIQVPQGHSEVELHFQPTPIRKLSHSISSITLFILTSIILFQLLKKSKSPKTVILISASVVLTFTIAEIFTRVLTGDPSGTACLTFDKTIHHIPAPNRTCSYSSTQSSNPSGKITIHFNDQSLRDGEVNIPKPENTYRILMLGDSTTAAINVELEETFSKKLEKMLQVHFSQKKVEVLIAAAPSYSPLLEYLYLREKGFELEPDLVIFNFSTTDIHDEARYYHLANISEEGRVSGVSEINENTPLIRKIHLALTEHSLLYSYYLQFSLTHLRDFFLRRPVLPPQKEFGQYEVDFLVALREQVKPNYAILWHWPEKSLSLIKSLVEEHHTPAILTLHPFPNQVSEKEWPGREVMGFEPGKIYPTRDLKMMQSIAESYKIPFVNMTEAFRSSDKFPLFYPEDIHFTPNGHEVFAQTLFEYLTKNAQDFGLPAN